MTKRVLTTSALALSALALSFAAAQTMKPLGFRLSKDMGMNMMMSGETVDISAYPGAKLMLSRVSGSTATLVYAGNDAKGVFAFYDRAIVAEGWKHAGAMMEDKMMSGSSMAGNHPMNGSSMAGDTMNGGVVGGTMMGTAADYTLKGHGLSLSVQASAGRVTVRFVSR